MNCETKYYVDPQGQLFIRQIYKDEDWGWYYYYNGTFRVISSTDPVFLFLKESLNEVSRKEFDTLYFTEKL